MCLLTLDVQLIGNLVHVSGLGVSDRTGVIARVCCGRVLQQVHLFPETQLVTVLVPTTLGTVATNTTNILAGKADLAAKNSGQLASDGKNVHWNNIS